MKRHTFLAVGVFWRFATASTSVAPKRVHTDDCPQDAALPIRETVGCPGSV